MKKLVLVIFCLVVPMLIMSCSKAKNMAPEDFIKIQTEFLTSDQSDAAKESISKKFGFSSKEYDDFEKKAESDLSLKTKLGELRLGTGSDKKK